MRSPSAPYRPTGWRRRHSLFLIGAIAAVLLTGTGYGAFVVLPSSGAQIDPTQQPDSAVGGVG
jgi:hypothetical protein